MNPDAQVVHNEPIEPNPFEEAIEAERSITIVVIGDSEAGKSSIIRTFKDNKFEEKYVPTVLEVYSGYINFKPNNEDTIRLKLTIHDTSGDD